MNNDLDGISVFMAIAEADSFRLAAERLGVTRSAVSQALQRLEDRLGVALVQRTTRSVRLTEAGEKLYESARPPLLDLAAALQATRELRQEPSGMLRLAVSSIAESFLSGPFIADFLALHPAIDMDITITDETFDIVAAGYDAGVRLVEVIEQDMIAVPVSSRQRQLAVASPDYIAARGAPLHPRDLLDHSLVGWRPRPDTAPYRWEFTEDGRDFDVAVQPRLTTNDMELMLRTACAGGGITFGMEETMRPYMARGELVPLLEPFCAPFPGFHLYYPRRQHQPAKLRALVDYLRRWNRRPDQPDS